MNNRKSPRERTRKTRQQDTAPDGDKAPAQMTEYIGRELRAMFDGVVAEPVPERFRQLLEELEDKKPKD